MFNTIELFAGVGGLALGVEKAGFNMLGVVNLMKTPVILLEKPT